VCFISKSGEGKSRAETSTFGKHAVLLFRPHQTNICFGTSFLYQILWERLALWTIQIPIFIYAITTKPSNGVKSPVRNLCFQTSTIHCHHSMYSKWKCYKTERGKLFNGLEKRRKNVFSFKCLPSLHSCRRRNNAMIEFFEVIMTEDGKIERRRLKSRSSSSHPAKVASKLF
jgi:hypothetical protein